MKLKLQYIEDYIRDNYIDESNSENYEDINYGFGIFDNQKPLLSSYVSAKQKQLVEENLKNRDKSFRDTLLELINKSGMTDAECYNKAGVTRQTFSKIKNIKKYQPSKKTVLLFCIALKLDLDAAQHLLSTAGFSLSHSEMSDLIVEGFIKMGHYDIDDINDFLYEKCKTTLVNVIE